MKMSKILFSFITIYLLLGVAALYSCGSQTTKGSQTKTVQAFQEPTVSSGNPTPFPAPVSLSTNITRLDYETALYKWRARRVLEYELTVSDLSRMDMGGDLTLRIK